MKKKIFVLALIGILSLGLLAGCASQEEEEAQEEITLGYVQWACAEASTHLMQEVFTQMGYEVETPVLQAGAMYEGLAGGELDAITTAWLPVTHQSYWEEYGANLTDLGTIMEGAKLGLVVPEYVEIDTIEEMKNNPEMFDREIVGIDPGAGIMQIAQDEVIPTYELEDWDLHESSGPAMVASLEGAIDQEEPIVVTGWAPHWKFASYDVKFLDDPKEAFGEAEIVKALGHDSIEEELPIAAEVLSNLELTSEQLGEIMLLIEEGMAPEEAAEEYVDNNLDLINSWLPEEHQLEK